VTLDTSFAPRYLSWCTYHWYSPTSALNLHCKTPVFHVSLTCSCMDFAGVWVVNLFVMHTEISYFARNTDACSCFEELHLAKTVCNLSLSIDLIKWTTGRFIQSHQNEEIFKPLYYLQRLSSSCRLEVQKQATNIRCTP